MPKKNPRTEGVPNTLTEAIEYFSDPAVTLAFMMTVRWPDGEIACPMCGSKAVRFLASRKVWQCGSHHLRRTFSLKTGTIMEDSPLPLNKWLAAIWLLVNCKNGISSYEIARDLDITQKSAWFMLQRIRLAMQEGSLMKVGGSGKVVEVDETFIGGAARKMNSKRHRKAVAEAKGLDETQGYNRFGGKAIVMGMLERGGKVVAKVVKSRHRTTLVPEVLKHVEPKSELHTDEYRSYGIFSESYSPADFEHKVIDHSIAYVDGNVHTNGMENFWSLLKRGLRGTYVSVEPFHLFRYLDEQMFRFNERENTDRGRFLRVMSMLGGKRLTYKQLIGDGTALEAHSPA